MALDSFEHEVDVSIQHPKDPETRKDPGSPKIQRIQENQEPLLAISVDISHFFFCISVFPMKRPTIYTAFLVLASIFAEYKKNFHMFLLSRWDEFWLVFSFKVKVF